MPAVSPHSPQGQLSRVPYLPGLDGMRALAVGAVMVYHANHGWLPGGFIGVEIFFVISGYLITLLLLGEEERAGFINLTAFWTRRFRRLLPALLTMLTLLGMYMAFTRDKAMGRTRGDFVAGFPFYGSNWYQIWVGQGYTASEAFVPLRHLWSLAVEEQFYLIWPVLMLFLLRNRNRGSQVRLGLRLAMIAAGISVVMAALYAGGDIQTSCSADQMNGYWRVFGRCISINDTLYLSSFTRASGILLGGALAMLWRPAALERSKVAGLGQRLTLIGLGGVAVLALLAATLTIEGDGERFGVRFNPWLFRGGLLVVGLATVAVIMAVTHKGSELGRWLGHPILNWVGTRSYGLYLYHWPIYQIIRHQAGLQLPLGQFALAMAITLSLAVALAHQQIARLYAGDKPAIVAMAGGLLVWVAAYHLADAVQALCVFILRCYRIAAATLVVYCVLLWGVGLAGGYWLAYQGLAGIAPMGSPVAFWAAGGAALALTALIFTGLLWRVARRARPAA